MYIPLSLKLLLMTTKKMNKIYFAGFITFSILNLFNLTFCYAQTLFEKTYQLNDGGLFNGFGLVTTDYLVWSGSSIPDGDAINISANDVWYGAIIVCNGAGDTIWTKSLEDTLLKSNYGNAIDNGDGTFFIVGFQTNLNNEPENYFIEKYSYQSSQSLNHFTFFDSISSDYYILQKLGNGDLLINGVFMDSLNAIVSCVNRIDSSGNLLWSTVMPSLSSSVNDIVKMKESGSEVLVAMSYLDNNYSSHLSMVTLDSVGQVISIDTFSNLPGSNASIYGLVFSQNNSNLIVSAVIPSPIYFDVYFLNFQTTSTLCQIIDSAGGYFTDVAGMGNYLSNNNSIFSGQTSSLSNGMQYDAYSILVDSSGHVLNTYHFGDQNYEDRFYMTGESNNAFISFGNSIRNTPNGLRNLAYIVRYDSLGNVSTGSTEPIRAQAVQVYPNPAKDHFKILAPKEYSNTKFHYSLLNQQGQVLVSDSFINETQVSISEYSGQQLCFLIVQGENYYQAFKIVIE